VDEQGVRPDKDLLDRTWDFFSSVRVATVLIFLVAAASIAGTLIPQEGQYASALPPEQFYPQEYGPVLGALLLRTGVTHLYSSWWYQTLLFLIAASLVICSLERFVPLWRAVQRPNPAPATEFVRGLKYRFTAPAARGDSPYADLAAALRARRYRVIEQGGRLYADKGRMGRWGPYITHIGLILLLVGAGIRTLPGAYLEEYIWLRDGEVVRVPGTDFYVESLGFAVDFGADGEPVNYQTRVRVLDAGGNVVKVGTIAVNEPLSYDRVGLYQSSYHADYGRAEVAVIDRAGGTEVGRFTIDLMQPEREYVAGDFRITVEAYYPDLAIDARGQPTSRSSRPANPGLKLAVVPPEGEPYTTWFLPLHPELEFDETTPVRFSTLRVEPVFTSGLQVKKDLGIPVVYVGLFVISAGVFAAFYIAHRRYWAFTEDGLVVVGGWTNRNPRSFARETAALARLLDPGRCAGDVEMEGEER